MWEHVAVDRWNIWRIGTAIQFGEARFDSMRNIELVDGCIVMKKQHMSADFAKCHFSRSNERSRSMRDA
jgi:hypothetical protein